MDSEIEALDAVAATVHRSLEEDLVTESGADLEVITSMVSIMVDMMDKASITFQQ